MTKFKTLATACLFMASIAIAGCGSGGEGAHQDDPTPGGEATPTETDAAGDPVMGDDYAKEQAK